MSRRLGVAVSAEGVVAALVERRGGRVRVRGQLAVPISAARTLDDALREVAEVLLEGKTAPTAVAPAPTDVWLKLLALPPLAPADRVRLLETEAERYFPVRGEPVLADVPPAGPVSAARAAAVEALVARVEESLGRVYAVEPAPRAALRAWVALIPPLRSRVFAVVARSGRWWEVTIARGATLLGHARLLAPQPDALAEAVAGAMGDTGVLPRVFLAADPGAGADGEEDAVAAALDARLPGVVVERRAEITAGVPLSLAAAVGLTLAPEGGLLPLSHRVRLRRGSRQRSAAWITGAALSAVLFLATGPVSQARTAATLEDEAAALRPRADSAAELLERARRSMTVVRFTDSLAQARTDWLGVLEELSRALPEGAHLTHFQGKSDSRTIEIRGYAGKASSIVPLLERSARFQAVETTEPVTRRSVGGVELENFSIRLQVAP